MKKTLLTLVLVAFSFIAFGQQLSYGIFGGVTFGAIQSSSSYENQTHTTGSHLSSEFGAFADVEYHNLSLQPAFIFIGKGGNVATGDGGDGQFSLHYIQIPVNLIYHIPIVIGNVYVGAGPYFAFGSSGTLSVNGPGGVDSEDVIFGGYGDFTKTDNGFDIIGGLQLKNGFLVRLNYDYGVANILNQKGPEAGLGYFKTRTFGVSVGFSF